MTYRCALPCLVVLLVVCAGLPTPAVGGTPPDSTVEHPTVGDRTVSDSPATPEYSTNSSDPSPSNGTVSEPREYTTFSATVVLESRSARSNSTSAARVWANRSSGAYRIESLDPENATWDVIVSNGSRLWAYHADENLVVTTDEIHGRFAEEVTGWARPFYYDDFFYSRADLAERLDVYHARSLGREAVAGRDTFVLQLRQSGRASRVAPDSATLWLDANRSFPVRIETRSKQRFGSDVRQTLSYRNLTFGAIPSDRFTFDSPAGANVTHPDAFRPFPVREPSLPADFQQTGFGAGGASRYENGTEIVQRRTFEADYANLTATITVKNHTRPNPREEFEVVEGPDAIRRYYGDRLPWPANDSVSAAQIRSVTGAAWTENGTAYAVWPCAGSYYVVQSSVSQSAVVEVARTISCEGERDSSEVPPALTRDDSDDSRPDSNGSDLDSLAANAPRIAPGVTTAGVVNPAALLAAHHESVTNGDFAAVVNETRAVRRGNGTTTLEFRQRFVYDAESGTYLATYRNESASDPTPTVVWGNGTAAIARTNASGHDFYEPVSAPTSSVPTGSSFLVSVFAKYDFAVREVANLTDSDRTKLLLEDDGAGVEAALVLDSSGRIYEFRLSRASESDRRTRRVEYRLLEDRTVSRFDFEWVSDAPADVEFRGRIGMEVEPNYVYLSHHYGEVIPAGSTVELTTDGKTYTAELGEPLRPTENRQLYVLDGSLVVTDHHPEAKAFGENLSSPVRFLLYTDEGVLVYQETFRWSSGERLSVGSEFELRRAVSHSRSAVCSRS
jgi:outer membrane lipoprotein-sorting protein